MIKTWGDVLRLCFVAVVITGCAITFMMLTASNPSADAFWKAAGMGLGGIGVWLIGKHSGIRAKEKE